MIELHDLLREVPCCIDWDVSWNPATPVKLIWFMGCLKDDWWLHCSRMVGSVWYLCTPNWDADRRSSKVDSLSVGGSARNQYCATLM